MAIPGKLHYSPDATFISYLFSQRGDLVRDLWRLDLATGTKAQWLSPPGEAVTEENISRAEALRRERLRLRETGITDYIWAEKANIPIYPIVHQAKATVEVEEHRYPFTGADNARVKLGLVHATDGAVRWLDLPAEDGYIARVDWHPDGRLLVQWLARNWQRLELLA